MTEPLFPEPSQTQKKPLTRSMQHFAQPAGTDTWHDAAGKARAGLHLRVGDGRRCLCKLLPTQVLLVPLLCLHAVGAAVAASSRGLEPRAECGWPPGHLFSALRVPADDPRLDQARHAGSS